MKYEWVIGEFTGEMAKIVKAHADAGLGYFIRSESGRGVGYTVQAAFRRAQDGLRPAELLACTPGQCATLDGLYDRRNNRQKTSRAKHAPSLADMFNKK